MNDHLSIEDLSALLDDALPGSARARSHLAACDACRGELQALRETVALVRGAPRRPLPEGADLRVPLAVLAATPQAHPRDAGEPSAADAQTLLRRGETLETTRPWWPRLSLLAAGSLAAALVLAVGLRAGLRAGEEAAPIADGSSWAVQQAPAAAVVQRSAATGDEATTAEMMPEADMMAQADDAEGAEAGPAFEWAPELTAAEDGDAAEDGAAEDDGAEDDALDVETADVETAGAADDDGARGARTPEVDAAADDIEALGGQPEGLPASTLAALLGLVLAIAALLAWRSRG